MIKDILKLLIDRLEMSEDEAIVAAIFCVGGFTIDSLFFAGGMLPGTVTVLSGASGFLGTKLFKKHPRYRKFVLRQLDRLVKEGHIDENKGKEIKEKIIREWYDEKE